MGRIFVSEGSAVIIINGKIEDKNIIKLQNEILREGSNRKDKLLIEMGDGEISQTFLNMLKAQQKEGLKLALKDLSAEKNKSLYSPPGHHSTWIKELL